MILYIERVTMEDGTYTNVYVDGIRKQFERDALMYSDKNVSFAQYDDGFRITNDEKSVRYYFVDLCKKPKTEYEKDLHTMIDAGMDTIANSYAWGSYSTLKRLYKKTGIKEKTLAIIIASAIDRAFDKVFEK